MPSGLLVWDLTLCQEFYEGWAANAEQVGRLLGGEPLVHRSHYDRLACGHGLNDAGQCLEYLLWQDQISPVGARDFDWSGVAPEEVSKFPQGLISGWR